MKSKIALSIIISLFFFSNADAESLREKLLEIDGVISVDVVEQKTNVFAEKYILTLSQPLDWSNPDSAMFPQRIEIGYQSDTSPNVFYVPGYLLNDGSFPNDDRHEIVKMYNANMIKPEYRFYGKSIPEGLSNDSTDLWQHLTDENASHDFHRIISELKDILSGRWVFAGASKGGQSTMIFASYYPDDADIYVASVAPFGDETDGKFTRYLYEEIGDEKYGTEQAAKYRAELLEFQVEAVKNREYLQNYYWNVVASEDFKMRPYVTKGILFDMMLLEFAVQVWQYDQKFDELEKVLAMPREDDPSTEINEKQEFLDAVIQQFKAANVTPYIWSVDYLLPYYIQAAKENGEHDYYFSHLRNALASEGSGAALSVTPDMEKDILFRMMFTDEQFSAFKFSADTRNRVYDFLRTTDRRVLILYSKSDPWYALRVPEFDGNTNVHYFADAGQSHILRIENLPNDMFYETVALLDEALNASYFNMQLREGNGGSSGCNFTGAGLILMMILMTGIYRRKYLQISDNTHTPHSGF